MGLLGRKILCTITDKAIDGEAPTLMDVGMAALELSGVSEVKAAVFGVIVSVAVGRKMTLKERAEEVVERSTRELAEMTVKDVMSVGTDDVLDLAEDFLGDGYEQVAECVFRSADVKSQVIITEADSIKVNNHAGASHINF
ncbi:MAG: hypothetical protein CSA81_05310 [Acidobacteria bacterium]|nr:MAG: hypothetical protein CSA81_05310 [Acidobacteriota bacterium]PIE90994.1 MAG: hypothetical protein CR997_03800 [Acidobacteriota bacterium]